jgi:hypothetical protein
MSGQGVVERLAAPENRMQQLERHTPSRNAGRPIRRSGNGRRGGPRFSGGTRLKVSRGHWHERQVYAAT